jgi:hypothetical protein
VGFLASALGRFLRNPRAAGLACPLGSALTSAPPPGISAPAVPEPPAKTAPSLSEEYWARLARAGIKRKVLPGPVVILRRT